MQIQFTVHEPYPSQNVTAAWHFRVRMREKLRWYYMLRAALGDTPFPHPTPEGLRKLTIDRYSTGTLDKVNLYGGAKYVVEDNLRRMKVTRGVYRTGKKKGQTWVKTQIGLGLLWDDDDKHCELVCNNVKCRRGEERTVITIEF